MVAGLDAKSILCCKTRSQKIGYLVVCSDKGLAGAYSSNALKKAVAEISEIEGDVVIITSGRRARDFFTRRGYNVISSHLGFSDKPSYNDAVAIATDAADVSVICSLMNCILFSLYLKPLCRKFRQAISSFR